MSIPMKSITITRAEGLHEEVDKPVAVPTWDDANALLRRWSNTAPKTGGYNKCDFIILYADDTIYSGRYDLQHWTVETPNLGRHVWQNLAFLAGRYKPPHMTADQYDKALTNNWLAREKANASEFLDTYEVPTP